MRTKYDVVGEWIGNLVGSLIAISVLLILVEITLRSIFSKTMYITDEYCGYIMAIISFWGLFYGELHDDHIQIKIVETCRNDIFVKVIKKMRTVCGIVFSVYLTYVLFMLFRESLKYHAVSLQISETPLAIPQGIVIPGVLLLVFAYIKRLMEC